MGKKHNSIAPYLARLTDHKAPGACFIVAGDRPYRRIIELPGFEPFLPGTVRYDPGVIGGGLWEGFLILHSVTVPDDHLIVVDERPYLQPGVLRLLDDLAREHRERLHRLQEDYARQLNDLERLHRERIHAAQQMYAESMARLKYEEPGA